MVKINTLHTSIKHTNTRTHTHTHSHAHVQSNWIPFEVWFKSSDLSMLITSFRTWWIDCDVYLSERVHLIVFFPVKWIEVVVVVVVEAIIHWLLKLLLLLLLCMLVLLLIHSTAHNWSFTASAAYKDHFGRNSENWWQKPNNNNIDGLIYFQGTTIYSNSDYNR